MDVVVREIVVPRRLLLRPGLLDEHVVVVEPNGAAAHELLRRIGCGGVGGHAQNSSTAGHAQKSRTWSW